MSLYAFSSDDGKSIVVMDDDNDGKGAPCLVIPNKSALPFIYALASIAEDNGDDIHIGFGEFGTCTDEA